MRVPEIFISAPNDFSSVVVNATQTITLPGTNSVSLDLITDSMRESGPGILIGLAVLVVILLTLRKMSRRVRAQRSITQNTGVSFAASVEIPPYVDKSNIASIAANIDPAEAAARLSDAWMRARKKVEANPLYSPNIHECLARDAIEIERIFCSGRLARCLANQPAEAFERFAETAEMLGSPEVSELIAEAKKLAIKGHSQAMQDEPRKGEAWIAFRQEMAGLEARIRGANLANGNAGRIVTLADAYVSKIAA